MAGEQRSAGAPMEIVDDFLTERRIVVDGVQSTHLLPDGVVLVNRAWLEVDLVADATQKGVVGELDRIQVGGKYQRQIEQHRKVLPAMQPQVVASFFHGNDPSIKQHVSRHTLAPQVIEDKYAVCGFELQWR